MPTSRHAVPSLTIANQQTLTQPGQIRYRARRHPELPHIVKFSGGRSSGLLLFVLLDNGLLKAERGDVVVFNNTAAEHPETYRFVAQCKHRCEAAGVPFFLVEFQTYEDARNGEWRRLPAYRLVNASPRSDQNPDGFCWRGEVFEEMLSHQGFVPNRFRRVCTKHLKLETTWKFLSDWLAGKEGIPALGHGHPTSLVDPDELHRQHVKNGGAIPKPILLAKKRYVLSCPTGRPAQSYRDFSTAAKPFTNDTLAGNIYGGKARFGPGAGEYLAFIGLRADEQLRVNRVQTRAANPNANAGYEGEQVYTPLVDLNIDKAAVNAFWQQQDWDLNLPYDGSLSNCVYCFLKGAGNLRQVHRAMEQQRDSTIPGFGPTAGTPCDLDWWRKQERRYGRDLDTESRQRTNPEASSFIGFFGSGNGFNYDRLAATGYDESAPAVGYQYELLPCDCTD